MRRDIADLLYSASGKGSYNVVARWETAPSGAPEM